MKWMVNFFNQLADLEVKLWLEHHQFSLSTNKDEIKPIFRREPLPLSFAQERLWFFQQLEGQNLTDNEGGVIRLEGNLDIDSLRQSIQEIIKRHETLRTNFQTREGVAYQVIHETIPLPLNQIHLSTLSPQEQESQVQQLIKTHFQTPFNLEEDILIRITLVCLSQTSYLLIVTLHPIICDHWSWGILINELSQFYRFYQEGSPFPFFPLKIQYTDYAVWQRECLREKKLQKQINYWQDKLAGLPPLLALPTDYPRPPVQTSKGLHIKFNLSKELSQQLSQFSQRQGISLFMFILSGLGILLSRYSRQEDIAIGLSSANRNRKEIEPLIGCFVNPLVMRINLEENPTVTELCNQVRRNSIEAYHNQDVPFEKLVEEINPERNMSHSPLFQVMFVLQNAPIEELSLSGLTLSSVEIETQLTKFDLTLSMVETEEVLTGKWHYNPDLFEKKTIERMSNHFQVLLEGMVNYPHEKVGQLPILTEEEKHRILVEWNDTVAKYPKGKCIHQLFEKQVLKTPDAVAVVYEEEQLTYRQLNEKANQLAHYLVKQGVKPDTLVGICMERSLEMIIGLLGILKAGGAYVPIDPNYPKERIEYVIQDSNMRVLLTQQHLKEQWARIYIPVISWEQKKESIDNYSSENIQTSIHSCQLAYVIYTSGSTGKPKGVQIEHQAVVNLLNSLRKTLNITSEDSLLAVTTIAFDIAALELYLPLMVGARILLARQETATDGHKLAHLLQTSSTTMMQATPATWRMLLAANWTGKSNLKVLCGGEALPTSLVQKLQDRSQKIWHVYGPTETTIWSSVYEVQYFPQTSEAIKKTQPIGHPIDNTQIYLLDSNLQPVPIGVTGELHIGGDGLARGYLNRPDLTAEKFILNPFDSTGQTRLYKTGDLCRYLPDGNLEYIGRIDHQVKMRGFRIELGEIESLLSRHSDIRENVVIAREDQGDQQLVAYIVSNILSDPPPPTLQRRLSQGLRNYLKEMLPDYMIPSAFVLLEKLPLTPNGKIDRKALPAPDFSDKGTESFIAPRDAIEIKLVQIWSKVLAVSPISIIDNFFELGGHSLLAVQLMSEIQEEFHQNLPLATFFKHPTIEQFASLLKAEIPSVSWSSLVPIQPQGEKPPFFCVPGAGGNVLYFYNLAHCLGKERPFYGLQAVGLDGKTEPHTSVEAMARHYVQLIQSIQPNGPYYLGGHSFGGLVAFEIAQQLQKQGEKVSLLALLDTQAPQHQREIQEDDEVFWLCTIIQNLKGLQQLNQDTSQEAEQLRDLSSEERLLYLKNCFQQANFMASNGDIRQVQALFKIYKMNHQMVYQPHHCLPTNIVVFRAKDALPEQDDQSQIAAWQDPYLGWQQWATDSIKVYTIPGDHITIISPPHVKVLANYLNETMDQAENR